MEQIISHIEYLLDRHECVIVPGFGAFINRYEPATIDLVNGIIIPPRRSISFNSELKHDDGLLASSYSRALETSYTASVALLNNDVDHLRATLIESGEVILGTLGTLSRDIDGFIIFTQSTGVFSSTGLHPINVTIEDKPEDTLTVTELSAPRRFNTLHRVMRYAAMLVILIGVGIILSTPLRYTPDTSVQKASVCPIETSQIRIESISETIPELLIAIPHEPQQQDITIIDNKYCLVIASLATREQANRFIAENENDVAGMFETNGRFRVYAVTGPTVASVTDNNLENKYPGAWPCAMPQE